MPTYRKKPVEIQAQLISILIDQAANDWDALPEWFRDAYEAGGLVICPTEIHIPTLEGTMVGPAESMLICGIAGELYPCKMEIFLETYDTD